MNDPIRIELPESKPAYVPGGELIGTLRWNRSEPFTEIELHLFWYTQGVGDQDSGLVETLRWENPGSQGERFFEIRLPRAPYSLHAANLEIKWALEATGKPGKDAARIELAIAPGRAPLKLEPVDSGSLNLRKFKDWIGVGNTAEESPQKESRS